MPCPAEAGDVLFFSYLTIHGSGINRTSEPRTTILIQMRDPSDPPSVRTHESRGQGMMLRGIDPSCCTVAPSSETRADHGRWGDGRPPGHGIALGAGLVHSVVVRVPPLTPTGVPPAVPGGAFGGVTVRVRSASETRLTVTAPAGAVSVVAAVGTGTSNALQYTYR